MKKILLTMFLLLSAVLLASCAHNHEKAENRVSDDIYHWYPCADEDCDAVLEKVEHTWGQGAITTKPTPSKDGIKSYLCTVCQRLKQESVKFESLYTVSKEQWNNAFSMVRFLNVTAAIEETRTNDGGEYKTVYNVQAADHVIYVTSTLYVNGEETRYVAKHQDGNFVWNLTNKNQTLDDVEMSLTLTPMQGHAVLSDNGFNRLNECFEQFEFDKSTGEYVAENLNFEDGKFGYSSVSVKIQDGSIVSITAITDEIQQTQIRVSYSDYGTTKPNPPRAEQSK